MYGTPLTIDVSKLFQTIFCLFIYYNLLFITPNLSVNKYDLTACLGILAWTHAKYKIVQKANKNPNLAGNSFFLKLFFKTILFKR